MLSKACAVSVIFAVCGGGDKSDPVTVEISPPFVIAGVGDFFSLIVTVNRPFEEADQAEVEGGTAPVTFAGADFVTGPGVSPSSARFDYVCEDAGQGTIQIEGAGHRQAVPVLCVGTTPDAIDDLLYSISSVAATFTPGYLDMTQFGAARFVIDDSFFRDTLESQPCVSRVGTDTVLCTPSPLPLVGPEFVVGYAKFDAPIPPVEPLHSLLFGFVVDSDGDDQNNWLPQGPFDFDQFQGTDRWFQAEYDHETTEWGVQVFEVGADQSRREEPSSVRIGVADNTVIFVVDASELPNSRPPFRMTSFGHPGAFEQDDSGGDVSGVDPTEPLAEADQCDDTGCLVCSEDICD